MSYEPNPIADAGLALLNNILVLHGLAPVGQGDLPLGDGEEAATWVLETYGPEIAYTHMLALSMALEGS